MFDGASGSDPMPLDVAVLLGVLLIVAGGALVEVGRRSLDGTLPRNGWVGIRTTATMANDEAWHAAHRASGRWLQVSGVVPIAVGVLLLFQPSNAVGLTLTFVALAWMLAWVIAAGRRGHRIAREMMA